jgi:hypothetical protein
MVDAKKSKTIFDRVAAFETEKNAEAACAVGAEDVVRREGEREIVGMLAELLIDAVDELESAGGVAIAPLVGLNPYSEELGGEMAATRGREVEMTVAERSGEVPGFIDEALRRVGVTVDDERVVQVFRQQGSSPVAVRVDVRCR